MFDLNVTLDGATDGVYTAGDPVTVHVTAADESAVTLDDVHYASAGDDGELIRFACDAGTASGTAVEGHGPLYVHAVAGDGRDAATYVPIPIRTASRRGAS